MHSIRRAAGNWSETNTPGPCSARFSITWRQSGISRMKGFGKFVAAGYHRRGAATSALLAKIQVSVSRLLSSTAVLLSSSAVLGDIAA